MVFEQTEIRGCFKIIPNIFSDNRGNFIKTFSQEIFTKNNLEPNWQEEYFSNSQQGVLRGLHFQLPPHDHAKLVYCTYGEVLDAIFDLRIGSPTYGKHILLVLSESNANIVYIPKGCAHGFYTSSKKATMMYKVSTAYAPEHDSGILWNSVGIQWPTQEPIVSNRDKHFLHFENFTNNPFFYTE